MIATNTVDQNFCRVLCKRRERKGGMRKEGGKEGRKGAKEGRKA
jgi:hypothetical protein